MIELCTFNCDAAKKNYLLLQRYLRKLILLEQGGRE
jgi:hypothetical protein